MSASYVYATLAFFDDGPNDIRVGEIFPVAGALELKVSSERYLRFIIDFFPTENSTGYKEDEMAYFRSIFPRTFPNQ